MQFAMRQLVLQKFKLEAKLVYKHFAVKCIYSRTPRGEQWEEFRENVDGKTENSMPWRKLHDSVKSARRKKFSQLLYHPCFSMICSRGSSIVFVVILAMTYMVPCLY